MGAEVTAKTVRPGYVPAPGTAAESARRQAETIRKQMERPSAHFAARRLLARLKLAPWEVRRICERAGDPIKPFDWSAVECGHGGRR
jgi:hypothetical protein